MRAQAVIEGYIVMSNTKNSTGEKNKVITNTQSLSSVTARGLLAQPGCCRFALRLAA
jgi:hypothetical protein